MKKVKIKQYKPDSKCCAGFVIKNKICPICKTELGLLFLKYKENFNQYPCPKCKLVYLESKIGLVNRAVLKSLSALMDNEKFENLLNGLGTS